MRAPGLAILGAVALAGCTVVGIRTGTEEPAYAVIATVADDIEIRRYAPRLAAATTVASADMSTAFRRLAAYIFGENQPAREIAMTAPVEVESGGQDIAMTAPVAVDRAASDGTMRMRFFLPAEFTLETAPRPLDDRVTVHTLPAQDLAVLSFTDFWGQRDSADAEARLLRGLDGAPWRPTGPVVAYYYDPPWTIPFLRRNEVAVPVQRTDTAATAP